MWVRHGCGLFFFTARDTMDNLTSSSRSPPEAGVTHAAVVPFQCQATPDEACSAPRYLPRCASAALSCASSPPARGEKSDTEATCCRARTWSACHLPWPHHSNSGKLRTLFWLIHHCCDPPVAGYSVAGYSHQWLGIQQLGLVVALFHDRVDVARAQVLFTPFPAICSRASSSVCPEAHPNEDILTLFIFLCFVCVFDSPGAEPHHDIKAKNTCMLPTTPHEET